MARPQDLTESLFGPELDERDLVSLAIALGAEDVKGWTSTEAAIAAGLEPPALRRTRDLRRQIRSGCDPLGELFCALRAREVRRLLGAVYTPKLIVSTMFDWCRTEPTPSRVIDPGCGSARFLLEAGARYPKAELIGIEIDPLAALIARANLAARGWAARSQVYLTDFREIQLDPTDGPTLFIGNPPYIRHHLIGPHWKQWLSSSAASLGLPASQLCGLHLHFYLATAMLGRIGDYGAYVTAAEWMDVNYGELLRRLAVRGLGAQTVTVIEPTASPFPDAAATASIMSFVLGRPPSHMRFRRVSSTASLRNLPAPKVVSVARLENEPRWSTFVRRSKPVPPGYVELGEICRVHRGQVTGANGVWVVDKTAALPESVLLPTVTRAKELINAGVRLSDSSRLRRVVDLPVELDRFHSEDRRLIDRFLKDAKARGADKGYVASNRRAWWAVRLREAAPILCTYMARRPPVFVENEASARHINIAHGLYPRAPLPSHLLRSLVAYLSRNVSTNLGRTYAGGLTKFEPGEIERIPVPDLSILGKLAT